MSTWTDLEYGDVAEALDWPRDRVWRYPIFFAISGPVQYAQLDSRLALVSDANKAIVLERARAILEQRANARSAAFDLLPNVFQADTVKKDERAGYETRKRVILDMQAELARLVDYYVNPVSALGSSGQPIAIG
jgi:hypothetical protein